MDERETVLPEPIRGDPHPVDTKHDPVHRGLANDEFDPELGGD